jgi:hypothetical protein
MLSSWDTILSTGALFAHVISAAKKLTSRARPDWVAEYPNTSVDLRLNEPRCSFTHFPC